MVSRQGSIYCVPSCGTLLLIALRLLTFPSTIKSDESQQQPYPRGNDDSMANDNDILFDNCDIGTYYQNYRDGQWGWNRTQIASLLFQTHRQVVPFEASLEFFQGEYSVDTFHQYAFNTDTRKALAKLDEGISIGNGNITTETVHMIFTNTDIPVAEGLTLGWEPGHLWPLEDLMDSLSKEGDVDYQNEAIAAIHDLHNMRPRHPIVNYGHHTNNWYYDSCKDCELDKDDITIEQRLEGNETTFEQQTEGRAFNARPEWGGIHYEGNEVRVDDEYAFEDEEGSDHLCVCILEHALQPPEAARGEIARALLYMNLRYGSSVPKSNRRRLDDTNLDLVLTDCHPLVQSDDYDDDGVNDNEIKQPIVNTMGYFSRLVKWHLEDPPNQREINRNDAICQQYQGNRNPFVDFYEESWALLDFERIEREVCAAGTWNSDWGSDDDDNYAATSESAEDDGTDNRIESTPDTTTQDQIEFGTFGCNELMPGDISFFMVQPDMNKDDSTDLSQIEEWQRKSFGLVTLVDLEPGLVLYVAGVDDEVDGMGIEWEGGVLKLEVPEKGIPTGSYFGHGSRMYLDAQWEPVLESGMRNSEFRFSVHQLYLYCTSDNEATVDSATEQAYKILAAMSTTGRSFGNNGLPSYWEKFQAEHSNVRLSENFSDGKHYGLIVLPEDASDSETSGGYRYAGPTFTKHDLYAKALIDEAYWKRINSLNRSEDIYQPSKDSLNIDDDSLGLSESMVDISELQPRLDFDSVENEDNSGGTVLCSLTLTRGWFPVLSFVTSMSYILR